MHNRPPRRRQGCAGAAQHLGSARAAGRRRNTQWLIWVGAVMAVLGLCTIVWSAIQVAKAKREGLSDEELKIRVTRMLPVNMGGLLTAVMGLMCVILGVSLG